MSSESDLLDAAMFSVWLHGNWRYLTMQMTTGEKEAAWAAVKRHDVRTEFGDPLTDESGAWWRGGSV